MDAFLQLSADDRRVLCEEAAARRGLPAPVMGKDFWVCWTLRELFQLPRWDGQLTIKGGTSLSKGWGLIARFSEDNKQLQQPGSGCLTLGIPALGN